VLEALSRTSSPLPPLPTLSPASGGEGFSNGFTLIELLVALAIFAMIATAGAALLGFSIEAQHNTARSLDRITALRRVSVLLAADLAQAVPRISRDARGDRQRAFIGDQPNGTGPMLAFVRAGWINDGDAPRSSLQKVAYRIEDGALVRRSWPIVDGVTDDRSIRSVLIRGVGAGRQRYRKSGAWRDLWDEHLPDAMPEAVELTMTIDGIGPVRQMFAIGAGR
jgi:general secretion pathway protein J